MIICCFLVNFTLDMFFLVIKVKFFFLKNFSYTWNIPVKWTEDNVSSITFYNRSETGGKYHQLIYFFFFALICHIKLI